MQHIYAFNINDYYIDMVLLLDCDCNGDNVNVNNPLILINIAVDVEHTRRIE